jgi:hypothetical protein
MSEAGPAVRADSEARRPHAGAAEVAAGRWGAAGGAQWGDADTLRWDV